MEKQRTYVCIDMKSFYASVECAERHLSPFETNLVVADETRGKGAITLAISPKMKSLGVKNRCRSGICLRCRLLLDLLDRHCR